MKCFQILNNEVLIVSGDKSYKDTLDNFTKDGGSLVFIDKDNKITLTNVVYDDQQSYALINAEFREKPIEAIEYKIAEIDSYIAAKETREYVPPTLEELRIQAINHQYQKYEAMKHAIVWLEDGSGYGFGCDEQDQNNWQIALTLMENDTTGFKVYTNKNDLDEKMFLEVTREQMLSAGKLAKAQQYEAYAEYDKVRSEINNCKTAKKLKQYLPDESA